MIKHPIEFKGIVLTKYFYDPSTKKVFGPRKERLSQKNNTGFSLQDDNNKTHWVSRTYLNEKYPSVETNIAPLEIDNELYPENLDNVCEFISLNFILTSRGEIELTHAYNLFKNFCRAKHYTPVSPFNFMEVLTTNYKVQKVMNDDNDVVIKGIHLDNFGIDSLTAMEQSSISFRDINEIVQGVAAITKEEPCVNNLKEVSSDNCFNWSMDSKTIAKAYAMLDDMDAYEFQIKERKAYEIMSKRNLDNKNLSDIMVGLAGQDVLAKELADSSKFIKSYIGMDSHSIIKAVSPYADPSLETHLIKAWRSQLREQYFEHIMYSHNGVCLRGYSALNIPLRTIDEIQSAFKLLNELYGWEESK